VGAQQLASCVFGSHEAVRFELEAVLFQLPPLHDGVPVSIAVSQLLRRRLLSTLLLQSPLQLSKKIRR
jgi:hypothetical protein